MSEPAPIGVLWPFVSTPIHWRSTPAPLTELHDVDHVRPASVDIEFEKFVSPCRSEKYSAPLTGSGCSSVSPPPMHVAGLPRKLPSARWKLAPPSLERKMNDCVVENPNGVLV